ncbi:MAG: hypothetical protein ACXU9A_17455, partial [Xanthobacteraceae bacterium]
DAYAHRGIVGRFGAARVRRVETTDLAACVEFAGLLQADDIRLRFGRPVALGDAGTFRRLFGLDDRKIESVGLFDLSGHLLGLATVAWVRPGNGGDRAHHPLRSAASRARCNTAGQCRQ